MRITLTQIAEHRDQVFGTASFADSIGETFPFQLVDRRASGTLLTANVSDDGSCVDLVFDVEGPESFRVLDGKWFSIRASRIAPDYVVRLTGFGMDKTQTEVVAVSGHGTSFTR